MAGAFSKRPEEQRAPLLARFLFVTCLKLEVKMELSELAPDTVIEEIANILADGYLRMIMAEAKNQLTWPSQEIAPDENLARCES